MPFPPQGAESGTRMLRFPGLMLRSPTLLPQAYIYCTHTHAHTLLGASIPSKSQHSVILDSLSSSRLISFRHKKENKTKKVTPYDAFEMRLGSLCVWRWQCLGAWRFVLKKSRQIHYLTKTFLAENTEAREPCLMSYSLPAVLNIFQFPYTFSSFIFFLLPLKVFVN